MQTLKQPQMKTTHLGKSVKMLMSPVVTAHDYESMTRLTERLVEANSSLAVVIDGLGKCTGVVTQTDVQKYFSLWIRFLDHDETVLDQIFETNAYCLLHIDRDHFHQVGRHMSTKVVTIPETANIEQAASKFAQHADIHHLVVVDADGKALGVVSALDFIACIPK